MILGFPGGGGYLTNDGVIDYMEIPQQATTQGSRGKKRV